MRRNYSDTRDFATWDEAHDWVLATRRRLLQTTLTEIRERPRGITKVFSRKFKPCRATVAGVVEVDV